jgi:DNA-binding LacI/PurR family transcriptional regulator
MVDDAAPSGAGRAATRRRVRRPTLRDVASEAGVSIQTVSNVIHGRLTQMSEPTQTKVRHAIEVLDYKIDRPASAMRSGLTRTIAFLVLDEHAAFLADPLTSMIIAGAGDIARDGDYGVLIQGSRPSANDRHLLSSLLEGRVDGAIVQLSGPVAVRAQQVRGMVDSGLPIVVMDEVERFGASATVRAEQREGARLLAEHLIERGHLRIAFIGPVVPWAVVEERVDGYRAAISAHAHDGVTGMVFLEARGYDAEYGTQLARQVLATSNRPTAIMCSSDLLALGALEAARGLGLAVPGDVAITGFDDFNFAAHVHPSLTTLAIPSYLMGKRAAEVLLRRIEDGDAEPEDVVFPTEVKIRGST